MSDFTFRTYVSARAVQHTGSDASIAAAARVSTQGVESLEDESSAQGLINYLMRDRHGSPFEHNSITFLVEAPIFVFREFMRHRVGWSYNEESGRYKKLEPVFYIPTKGRDLVQVGKPGAYTFTAGSDDQMQQVHFQLAQNSVDSYDRYRRMLKAGIAREVARMVLPLNIFSSMYATANARSIMHFLSLRTTSELAKYPSFPQREIEMVAMKIEDIFAEKFPLTYAAYNANGRVAP